MRFTLTTLDAFIWSCLSLVAISTLPAAAQTSQTSSTQFSVRQLADLPNSVGVAGPFCGLIDNGLVVAGGANFPDQMPWDGGSKVWHSDIYLLESPTGEWKRVGELPRPLGYGVSITVPEGLLCIGGSDPQQHYADVFLLQRDKDSIRIVELASLPIPLANMAGALVGNSVVLGGGNSEPGEQSASSRFFILEPTLEKDRWKQAAWREMDGFPGEARILPQAASLGDSFYVFGGAAIVLPEDTEGNAAPRRKYLNDGWRWNAERGWSPIADLPAPLMASPAPCPSIGFSHFLVAGGDDGSRAGFQPVAEHPGFSNRLLAYHAVTDTWAEVGAIDTPRVTTGFVPWNGRYVIPSGEVRPGVRSAEVLEWEILPHQPNFGLVNYGVLIGYLLLIFAVGLSFTGSNNNTKQFFRADQEIPWWAAGLSIFATMLSSITFLSIPAQGYSTGWNLFLGSVYVLLTPIVILYYVPFFRRLDVTSAYEYLERRFNLAVRLFASFQFMLFQLGRIAVVLFLPSLALSTVAGVNIFVSIVLVGIVCVFYTMFGGMKAVIWTDVAQTVILLGGAIWALTTLVLNIPGGAAEIVSTAQAHGRFFESVNWDLSTNVMVTTGWIIMLGSLFSNLFSYTASQDVVQRYLTTASERDAGRAIWTNAFMAPLAQALFFAIGTAIFVFYLNRPEKLHPSISNDSIFPYFIVMELPVGVVGLVVAAIFAASQSTVSSSLNSFAAAYITDFHRRLIPSTSDETALRLARWVVLVVGVIGVGLAVALARIENIRSLWEIFIAVLGLFGSSVSGLFVLGIFSRKTHATGALVGAVASMVLVVLLFMMNAVFWWYSVVGVVSCVLVGYLASLGLPGTAHHHGLTVHSLASNEKQI